MPRLFLALPILEELQRLLGRISLPDRRGVRRVRQSQLHLTLHFIGEKDPGFILEAVSATRAPAFSLCLDQLGLFGGPASGGALWVGPTNSAAVKYVHEEFAQSLSAASVSLEARPFAPHVTLARFSRGIKASALTDFLDQRLPSLPALHVDRVVLYSSHPEASGICYREEGAIPLLSCEQKPRS